MILNRSGEILARPTGGKVKLEMGT